MIVHDAEQAKRDVAKRGDIIPEAVCELRAHKVYGCYVRELKSGKLKLDKAKSEAEAKLDGEA